MCQNTIGIRQGYCSLWEKKLLKQKNSTNIVGYSIVIKLEKYERSIIVFTLMFRLEYMLGNLQTTIGYNFFLQIVR